VSEARSWIESYFAEHGELGGRDVSDLGEENYVSSQLLSSLGIVQLLVGIEEEFGVWLDPAEMQDPRFCSIAGLSELVEEARTRA
jgi:acyl carrier protein